MDATTGPSPRSEHAAVYDAGRGRMVLFGGVGPSRVPLSNTITKAADTWEWDGTYWLPAAIDGVPQTLGSPRLAFDSRRGRVVQYPGVGLLAPGEVWEWDGGRWFPVTPPSGPPSRYQHAIAFDGARGRLVLFGGSAGLGPLADTWEWDGAVWTQRFPAASPPARMNHRMTFDEARARVVLFGGTAQGDTWEWDGTTWHARPTTTAPAFQPRAMAYDRGRRRTVLLGGAASNETWEWDGASWTQRFPAASPSVFTSSAMAHDSSRNRVVLLGGAGDLWDWDGTEWTARDIQPAPDARANQDLVYDGSRSRLLLFGGSSGPARRYDTWELAIPVGPAGPGAPGGGLPTWWAGVPRLGWTLCVGFSHPWPQGAGFGMLALSPGPPIAPPAALHPPGVCAPALLHLLPHFVLHVRGDPAIFCLPIPASPAFVGVTLTLQGAALETGPCFRLADALVAVVQP